MSEQLSGTESFDCCVRFECSILARLSHRVRFDREHTHTHDNRTIGSILETGQSNCFCVCMCVLKSDLEGSDKAITRATRPPQIDSLERASQLSRLPLSLSPTIPWV